SIEQILLPRAVLLGWRADELDREIELRTIRGDIDEGADVGHGDEVVAAAVADLRQRVVLREERQGRSRRGPDARPERGRDAGDAALDFETLVLQQRADAIHRAALLIRELGIIVDLTRQP